MPEFYNSGPAVDEWNQRTGSAPSHHYVCWTHVPDVQAWPETTVLERYQPGEPPGQWEVDEYFPDDPTMGECPYCRAARQDAR